jgi:ankyrin repeat protein
LLIEHKADVNKPDAHGLTPFAIASKAGHKRMMDLLRAHGGTE